jgi:hypothetical protein
VAFRCHATVTASPIDTTTPIADVVSTPGAFPLITTVQGKRYELYSDGTFAEVEKAGGPSRSPSRLAATRGPLY